MLGQAINQSIKGQAFESVKFK